MTLPSVLCVLLCGATIVQAAQPSNCCNEIKHMRINARHIEAEGIGYNQGYTTLETFLAPDNDAALVPFLDLRAHVFNNGKFAANAGVGGRAIWGSRVYGINAYYDYRNTERQHYNQVGAGLEMLGKVWDVRVNGYLPVTSTTSGYYNPSFAGFTGHSLRVKRKIQSAMRGVDGELGAHIGRNCDYDFYAALGPYYFQGRHGKAAVGGKARVAVSYKDYLTLEISDSLDSVFNNRVQGQLTLSVPLGPKTRLKKSHNPCPPTCSFDSSCPKTDDNAYALTQRLMQPVTRQEIVVVSTSSKTWTASNAFSIIFVNNLSHSNGTFESPYPTLALAQANSAPGDIIYVFPGDGTTNGMSSGIVLQPNQSFWGSNVSHQVPTNFGIVTIPAQSSSAPHMTNTGGDAITLANGNDVSGFFIAPTPGNGVTGTFLDTSSLSNLTISQPGLEGISINGIITLSINNVHISGSAQNGMNLTAPNTSTANYTITNSSAALNGQSGIILNAGGSTEFNVVMTNNAVSGSPMQGILLTGTAGIINSSMVNCSVANNKLGMFINPTANNLTFTIDSSSLTDNTLEGLLLDAILNDTLNLNALGCLFEGNGHRGILVNVNPIFAAVNTNVDISRCSFINNSQIGMDSGLYINYNPLAALSTFNLNVSANFFTNNNPVGLNIQTAVITSGTMNINVSSNSAESNSNFAGINWTDASIGTATANAVFANNVLNGNTGTGIDINSEGKTNATVLVKSNVFTNNTDAGLHADQMGTGSLCLTIDSNNSDNGYNFAQISGTFNVVNKGNNIGTITTSGTIGNPVTCP